MSGVEGIHFKEATSINLSLTTLGRVIDVLLENAQTKRKPNQRRLLPPYRDSLLTWILSESIGGNSRTLMIAAVSPSRLNYEETLSTLRYSSCARQVCPAGGAQGRGVALGIVVHRLFFALWLLCNSNGVQVEACMMGNARF